MLSLFVLAPISVVVTAVLVFAQSGARITWTKGTEPRGREAQRTADTAEKRPRKAQGTPKGRPKENMGSEDREGQTQGAGSADGAKGLLLPRIV